MGVDGDARALEEREPEIAEGRFRIGHDQVLAMFHARSTAGDEGGAVAEVVDALDVAPVAQRGVIKERAAIGFPRGFQFVDEVGQQFGLLFIAHLGHLLAGAAGVVAHVVAADGGPEAADEGVHRLAIGQHASGIHLHGSHHQVVHDFDLLVAFDLAIGLVHDVLGLDLRHVEPLFFLGEARFDVANRLQVLVEFVGIRFTEPPAHTTGIIDHGVKHAALLFEHGLTLGQRRVVLRKETVIGGDRIVQSSDGFALAIPGQRQPRPVTGSLGLIATQLNGGEACVLTQHFGGNLIRRNAVVETLAGLGVSIGPGEVEGAPPVRLIGELIREPLNDGDVLLMSLKRFQSRRQFVVWADGLHVGIPGLPRDTPAEAEKNHPLRPSQRGGGRGKAPPSQRFEHREGNQGGTAAEKAAAGGQGRFHGGRAV